VAAIAEQLSLRRNEFAFHFETDNGVAVDMLATFLRRAATVARSQGADLRVVGVRAGSLAVTLAAVRRGAAKEFTEKPIDTTIKASGFVAAIVAAIVAAMSPAKSGVSPMATAAVELVDRHEVTQITIVTSEANTVLMNKEISRRVRETRVHGGHAPAQPKATAGHISQHVVELDEDARRGDLSGEVLLVGRDLHFRPDGYKFLVPVDTTASHGIRQLLPSRRYRVTGRITTLGGQPDHIVVDSAVPL
jgi:hypothetical protein